MSKYYIQQRNLENGKLRTILEFDSFDDLFFKETESRIASEFRTDDSIRIDTTVWSSAFGYLPVKAFAKVLYNHNHNVVPVDVIIGEFRKYRKARWAVRCDRIYQRRQGRKKGAYGWLRHLRTFHERKWNHAWDDEEFAPKPRGKRTGHNLPDTWDDYWAQAQKSWKWQSKRQHQWYRER